MLCYRRGYAVYAIGRHGCAGDSGPPAAHVVAGMALSVLVKMLRQVMRMLLQVRRRHTQRVFA